MKQILTYMKTVKFKAKEDDQEILISADEIAEIIPDADMRFTLVILKNDDKHFICGTEAEIRERLGLGG
ncbi:hypothetical protein [Dyadobacter aurulentus]|uniref:hypothetical protein n=1 Tax=Dyadobacter sp. UC 10 TaxID=2605428 RepID=UPI001CEC8741|nr:hypothetical protein [Dyadobacter sp. UC 10]